MLSTGTRRTRGHDHRRGVERRSQCTRPMPARDSRPSGTERSQRSAARSASESAEPSAVRRRLRGRHRRQLHARRRARHDLPTPPRPRARTTGPAPSAAARRLWLPGKTPRRLCARLNGQKSTTGTPQSARASAARTARWQWDQSSSAWFGSFKLPRIQHQTRGVSASRDQSQSHVTETTSALRKADLTAHVLCAHLPWRTHKRVGLIAV